jgi:multimeric flavodoxin WrbA
MKITIINGNKNNGEPLFSRLPHYVAEKLGQGQGQDHEITCFNLAEMNIRQCIGCWNCWCKTPGVCTHKDDAPEIMKSVIQSDLLIFASPLMRGFTSSLLKRLQDRLIVLIHPYIELVQGECHHRKRYEKSPDMALVLQNESDTDEEDMEIITDIYKRLALNFHSKLKHIWIEEPIMEETIL